METITCFGDRINVSLYNCLIAFVYSEMDVQETGISYII